jgi:hypothetical protein
LFLASLLLLPSLQLLVSLLLQACIWVPTVANIHTVAGWFLTSPLVQVFFLTFGVTAVAGESLCL